MRLLNIVSSGYRATVEEQDDTVVWITHALRKAGADVDLLVRGAASNYPVKGQCVAPITLGGRVQRHAPDVYGQIRQFAEAGARILALSEDLDKRGIDHAALLDGVEIVRMDELPTLLKGYDQVWQW